jgi:hypothetical protein
VRPEKIVPNTMSLNGDGSGKGNERNDSGRGLLDWVVWWAYRSLASVAIISVALIVCHPSRLVSRNLVGIEWDPGCGRLISRNLVGIKGCVQVIVKAEIELAKSSVWWIGSLGEEIEWTNSGKTVSCSSDSDDGIISSSVTSSYSRKWRNQVVDGWWDYSRNWRSWIVGGCGSLCLMTATTASSHISSTENHLGITLALCRFLSLVSEYDVEVLFFNLRVLEQDFCFRSFGGCFDFLGMLVLETYILRIYRAL